MVYDITNPESFKGAKSWVKELQRRGDPSVIIALAGNKADLASRRKVRKKGEVVVCGDGRAAGYVLSATRKHLHLRFNRSIDDT